MGFNKYEGAGNDFILLDDRNGGFPASDRVLIKHLCDRRFGIGADGLMLLQSRTGYDFNMAYFNSDGNESSMCGNGGRCIVAFAGKLGIIKDKARFMASDGEHLAELKSVDFVKLKMKDVSTVEKGDDFYFLNTGSPHYVKFLTAVSDYDVYAEGRKIRYSERFRENGTNVNFVENHADHIFVRTYERGVENETLACGTGVVAAAICAALEKKHDNNSFSLPVKVMGGTLKVSFNRQASRFMDIWLEGPATFVFEGRIEM